MIMGRSLRSPIRLDGAVGRFDGAKRLAGGLEAPRRLWAGREDPFDVVDGFEPADAEIK